MTCAEQTPSPWIPESDPQNLRVLGKAGEETNELGAILSAIQGAEPVESDIPEIAERGARGERLSATERSAWSGYELGFRDGRKASPDAGLVGELVEGLRRLEHANERVVSLQSHWGYMQRLSDVGSECLLALDDARVAARDLLARAEKAGVR